MAFSVCKAAVGYIKNESCSTFAFNGKNKIGKEINLLRNLLADVAFRQIFFRDVPVYNTRFKSICSLAYGKFYMAVFFGFFIKSDTGNGLCDIPVFYFVYNAGI
ncbi:MAG: hypothetical protein V4581_17885 [Bacteroidota bacterium]